MSNHPFVIEQIYRCACLKSLGCYYGQRTNEKMVFPDIRILNRLSDLNFHFQVERRVNINTCVRLRKLYPEKN